MSRRTLIGLLVPLVLIGGYFGVTAYIRAQVDELIQHAVGGPLPKFSLQARDGATWSNEQLAGKRAILHFFRSFCGSCEVEAPVFRELEKELPDDVVLLHVMTDEVLEFDPKVTAETIARKQFTRPILMADQAFVDAFHSVKWSHVTPVTYIVDATGVVRFGLRGAQQRETIDKALAAAR